MTMSCTWYGCSRPSLSSSMRHCSSFMRHGLHHRLSSALPVSLPRPHVSWLSLLALPHLCQSQTQTQTQMMRHRKLDAQPQDSMSCQQDHPSLGLSGRSMQPSSPACQRLVIKEAKARLAMYGQGMNVDTTSDDVWLEALQSIMLPAQQYVAGFTQKHVPAWTEWLGDSAQAQQVLQAIAQGLCFDFVSPSDRVSTAAPPCWDRLDQVRIMLSKLVGPQQTKQLLSGATP